MTNLTSRQTSFVAQYDAATARLGELRAVALEGFKKAQDLGDIAEGDKWTSTLRHGLEDFKCFLNGLPRVIRHSIEAERILESFVVDRDNVVNLVIPAEMNDEAAMRALNVRFRFLFPELNRDAIWAKHIPPISSLDHMGARGVGEPRIIKLIGLVPGTNSRLPEEQSEVLTSKGLIRSHPIEQALAAAAYACMRSGTDLFKGAYVRGSVPGIGLHTSSYRGISLDETVVKCVRNCLVYVSASPRPELT